MYVSLNVLCSCFFLFVVMLFSLVQYQIFFLLKCKCLNKHIVSKAYCDVQPTFLLWHLLLFASLFLPVSFLLLLFLPIAFPLSVQ